MPSEDGTVQSYASVGLRLWAEHKRPHGVFCPCLICGDTRAYLDIRNAPDPYRVMAVPKNDDEDASA